MSLHILPRIGSLLLADVRPRHIRDLVLALRDAGELAPATIRQVSGLLHTMFKSAVIEELLDSNPVVFERGTLPKKVDKDPTWRHEAIYTRGEIEMLISNERVLADRRVLYGLKSLAALRHTEAATLTWSQYDGVSMPLGALNLGVTKNGVPRKIRSTRRSPRCSRSGSSPAGRRPMGRVTAGKGTITTSERARQQKRRHDMRRTFITLARTDGAAKDILRWVTHGPGWRDGSLQLIRLVDALR